MTELMKQLQQWANEGKIVFPEGEKKGYLKGTLDDPNRKELGVIGTHNLFSLGGICYSFAIKDAIQLVLDGTIQVWRPVEHYPITGEYENCLGLLKDGTRVHINVKCGFINAKSLEIDLDDENYDGDTSVDFDNVTHWQPLPQFIHGERKTNDV